MKILIILLVVYMWSGVYSLDELEYSRMPPVFHLDDYESCVINPNGIYCTADVELVSDAPSELLTMIKNYSDNSKKHFNHTQLHYGICITQTCKHIYNNKTSEDLKLILEGCLNESLWNNYQLKSRISAPLYCNSRKYNIIDSGDIAMGVFIVVLIMINIIGSVYDIIIVKRKGKKGNAFLLCFSIPQNFKKLIYSYQNLESRKKRLQGFHGLRTLTIMCVIYFHSMMIFSIAPENTYYAEKLYDNILNFIFLNGMINVQTFFIISGCLLAYNIKIYEEKHEIKWAMLPTLIIMTWMKLTPSYAFVLGLTCTWLRYLGSGPLWEIAIAKEVNDCRSNGWANLLYINNYLDNTQCMLQTWYLGAVMQLSILGYTVCILIKKDRIRQITLVLLFVIGILTPAVHTYFQNLDAIYLVVPDSARTFLSNQTFNYVYKRGHTNLVNFVLGLALGFFIHRLQNEKVDMKRYKKYWYLFTLTFPAIIGSMFIGCIFFIEGYEAPILARAIYAGLIKPIFGIVLSLLIIGNVFKLDYVYRKILEWDGWKIPSKLSYCAYIVHIFIIRAASGNTTTLTQFVYLTMIEQMITFIVLSFIAAIPLWILLDSPVTELMKMLVSNKNQDNREPVERNVVKKRTINDDEEMKY